MSRPCPAVSEAVKLDCGLRCAGDRVLTGSCTSRKVGEKDQYACGCVTGYFSDKAACDSECHNAHWSLFTYGNCNTNADSATECEMYCGTRIRLWTTVFIFVLFAAAVVVLVFILPMCIASCSACLTAKKERKNRKKVDTISYAMR